ncbi:GbsR/MarR family transcriptional regulator [Limimaricola litoreus]|uniref:MarR family transcriptional regulator n=1 Tax=Limimaricola litoreus TaxID=2955316 RepID=A0A9X2FRA4_9RHOB|nr:MarR family transcriptional regulator [Limimaricola litoreus]MCP1168534.1 MarR family transcriptional regulator [Limimaricola litoreus]
MTDTSPGGLDEVRSDFIEKVGLIAQNEGLPRIAGRIFALLLFDGEIVSFGEIAEGLQVSRGSVSSATRLLEDRGLVKRVGKPGQRQDFFRLADNPYRNMLENVVTGLDRARGEIGDTLRQLPQDRPEIRKRVQDYARFYEVMGRAISQSIENLD